MCLKNKIALLHFILGTAELRSKNFSSFLGDAPYVQRFPTVHMVKV